MATDTKYRRVIKRLGGADRIHRELRGFSKRVERFESSRRELTEKYPNKWVAMHDGDIVGVAGSLQQLLEDLDSKGISTEEALIEYLSTKPRQLIL